MHPNSRWNCKWAKCNYRLLHTRRAGHWSNSCSTATIIYLSGWKRWSIFYDYYKCVGVHASQKWSTWLATKKTNRCGIDVHSHFNHTLTVNRFSYWGTVGAHKQLDKIINVPINVENQPLGRLCGKKNYERTTHMRWIYSKWIIRHLIHCTCVISDFCTL